MKHSTPYLQSSPYRCSHTTDNPVLPKYMYSHCAKKLHLKKINAEHKADRFFFKAFKFTRPRRMLLYSINYCNSVSKGRDHLRRKRMGEGRDCGEMEGWSRYPIPIPYDIR